MQFLMTLHGEIRWLLVLAAVALAARSTWGWLAGSTYRKVDRALVGTFSGLLDLNLLLGLILLFSLPGGLLAFRLEHAVTMLVAIVAGHAPMLWRKSGDSKRKHRNNLFVVLAVVVFVVVGVLRLRGGWIY